MLVTTDVAHDARVVREAAALAAAGHRVHVRGKDVPPDWTPPAGVTVASTGGGGGLRGGTPSPAAPTGQGQRQASATPSERAAAKRRRNPLFRTARWWLLPLHRRRVWSRWNRVTEAEVTAEGRRYDVVHAHDFNTLPLAARLAAAWGSRLVYDAHEWWSGRQRHGRPTPFERLRERRTEAALVGRADAVLTVSEGISLRLARWTAARTPVAVVRNTFPRVPVPQPAEADGEAGAAADAMPRGVVYAGRIGGGRDLETVLGSAVPLRAAESGGAAAGLATVLVGPVDESYAARLDLAGSGAELRPTLDGDKVDEVLREVGISVVTLTDTCENHRLALPNKLFHAVRAGVPVVAADLPEIRRVVERYAIGELYRPGDPASYQAAVRRAVARYEELRAGVRAAVDELSWERDAQRLVELYAGLAADGAASDGAASDGTASGGTTAAAEPAAEALPTPAGGTQ